MKPIINSSTQKKILNFIRMYLPDTIAVLVIAVVSIRFALNMEKALDIGLYDESNYLRQGIELTKNGFPDASNAPLYAIWYYILSFITADRMKLYYFNYEILSTLPSLLFYGFLRIRKVSLPAALLAGCLIVTFQGNLQIWPKVSHFTLCVLLSGIILTSLCKNPVCIFGAVSLTALAASYARPEYFVAFILSAFTCFITAIRSKEKCDYITPTAVILTFIAALVIFGVPIGNDSGRSFFAFQQHFSLNWVTWTDSSLNPFTDSAQIVRNCFGNARSAIQCTFTDPALVLKHVLANILNLPRFAAGLLLLPTQQNTELLWHSGISILHLIAITTLAAMTLRNFSFSCITNARCSNISLAGTIAILIIPPLIASVLIYPRAHYLILIIVPILGLGLVLTGNCCMKLRHGQALGIIAIATFFLFMTSNAFEADDNFPVKSTITFLQTLMPSRDVQLLEAEGGFDIYLNDKWHRVAEYDKIESFHAFRSRTHINSILLTEKLTKNSRFCSDPEWLRFLAAPETYNFTSIPIPETEFRLLYKKGLFKKYSHTKLQSRRSDKNYYKLFMIFSKNRETPFKETLSPLFCSQ